MRAAIVALMVWAVGLLPAAGQQSPRPLAIEQYNRTGSFMIAVTSTAFTMNASIPAKHADYGEKVSPALSWTVIPSAKSFVVIAEDPDAKEPKPFVHWLLYNLPPSFRDLPEAVPGSPRLPEFGGALQGRNSRGTIGYFGPRPPKGDPAHHYHFQVFAVDSMLELDPGASASAVLAALNGHVVGRGELVGLYRAP